MEKRILIFDRTMKLGGAEKVVCQMCKYLKSEFDEIIVCSSGGVNEEVLKELNIKHYRIYDVCTKNPLTFFINFILLFQIIKNY